MLSINHGYLVSSHRCRTVTWLMTAMGLLSNLVNHDSYLYITTITIIIHIICGKPKVYEALFKCDLWVEVCCFCSRALQRVIEYWQVFDGHGDQYYL